MDGLALLTKATAVTTPAAVTEDDDDELFVLSGDSARRDGTDGPRRRANVATRKRPAAVVETGPAAARAAAEAAFGLARVRDEVKAPAHARAHVPEWGRTQAWRPPAPRAPAWSRPAPGRARAKTVVGQRAVNAKESSVAQYNFALKHFEPFAASRGLCGIKLQAPHAIDAKLSLWIRLLDGVKILRHRCDIVPGTAAARWRGSSRGSLTYSLVDLHTGRGETVEACIAFVSADGTIKDDTLKAFNAFLLAAPARVSAAASRITTPAPARYSRDAFLAGPRASTRTASSGCSGP